MPVSKGRHLVMFDRRIIEDMLRDGESVGAIAVRIDVSWATVAREIKRHRTRDTTHYQNLDDKNLCQFRDSCRMTNMCRTGCNSRCSRCASAACNRVCEKYVEVPECPKLSKAPYVCNGCRSRITLTCRHRCWFYDADAANEEAAWAKVACRQGVDCTPEELAAMVAVVKPLMKKGQSLSHIWQTHGSEFPVGARTRSRSGIPWRAGHTKTSRGSTTTSRCRPSRWIAWCRPGARTRPSSRSCSGASAFRSW